MNYYYEDKYYHIKTSNLETIDGIKNALNTLTIAFSDYVKNGGRDDMFYCLFYVKGELLEEKYISSFWSIIGKNEDAHDAIFEYINILKSHIVSGGKSSETDQYGLGERAIYALSMIDKKFVPLYSEFLQLWDMGHEVCQAEEVEEIVEKYGWCIEIENLIIERSFCNGQHDLECLEIFEPFLKENITDLSSSDFFKKLLCKFCKVIDDDEELTDLLEFYLLPYMHDDARKFMENKKDLDDKKNIVNKGKYRVSLREDQIFYVVVTKEMEGKEICHWIFDLGTSDERLALVKVYDQTLIIVDGKGVVRGYDIATKQLTTEYDLNAGVNSDRSYAIISKGRRELVVINPQPKSESHEYTMTVFCLEKMKAIRAYGIESLPYVRSLMFGLEDQLIFYENIKDYKKGDGSRIHTVFTMDIVTGEGCKYVLPNPANIDWEMNTPYFNKSNNLMVLPSFTDLTIVENDEGRKCFDYNVTLFDLVTFGRTNPVFIARISIEDSSIFSNRLEEVEEAFSLKESKPELYMEIQNDFYQSLRDVVFDDDRNSMWFCFRGGLVINMNYNGEVLFRMLPKSLSSRIESDAFPSFSCNIRSVSKDKIVIVEPSSQYDVFLSEDDFNNPEIIIRKDFIPVTFEDDVVYTPKEKQIISNMGKTVIEVTNLIEYSCLMDALLEVCSLGGNAGRLIRGSSVAIELWDEKGNILKEEEFYRRVVNNDAAAALVNELLIDLFEYSGFPYLFYNETTRAFAYAVHYLAMYDEKYLCTACAYLDEIDFIYDEYIRFELIPDISMKYPDSKLIKDLNEEIKDW